MSASKKAANLSVDAVPSQEARDHGINLSVALEHARADVGTRVVIPLTPATVAAKRGAMQTLTPVCTVEGRPYLLLTPQLAGSSA